MNFHKQKANYRDTKNINKPSHNQLLNSELLDRLSIEEMDLIVGADDVIVDGRIITAENYDSSRSPFPIKKP